MNTTKKPEKSRKPLFEAILNLKSLEDCERFFWDLCTPAELNAMAGRWEVARLLEQSLPYRKIHVLTGVSTVTVTRVARSLLQKGSGYALVLTRMKSEESNERQ